MFTAVTFTMVSTFLEKDVHQWMLLNLWNICYKTQLSSKMENTSDINVYIDEFKTIMMKERKLLQNVLIGTFVG